MDVLSQKSSKSSVVFSISCFMLYNLIRLYASASRFILSSVFIIPMTISFSSWNCSLNIPNGPSTLDLFAYSSLYFCFSILWFIAFCNSEPYSVIVLCVCEDAGICRTSQRKYGCQLCEV